MFATVDVANVARAISSMQFCFSDSHFFIRCVCVCVWESMSECHLLGKGKRTWTPLGRIADCRLVIDCSRLQSELTTSIDQLGFGAELLIKTDESQICSDLHIKSGNNRRPEEKIPGGLLKKKDEEDDVLLQPCRCIFMSRQSPDAE